MPGHRVFDIFIRSATQDAFGRAETPRQLPDRRTIHPDEARTTSAGRAFIGRVPAINGYKPT